MLKNPEIACEITLQPVRRFDFDAAIIFSDILTIPDAMGLELHFAENEGPRFMRPPESESDILGLSPPPEGSLNYVAEACALARKALPAGTPLIGFCGAPWTLACYMLEKGGGGGGKAGAFWAARTMRHSRPDLLRRILEINAAACADLLSAQLSAGAQVAMIFDSWGGLLDGRGYEEFSLAYVRRIISDLRGRFPGAPVVVFGRGCGFHLPQIAAAGCDAAGVDWQIPLSAARRAVAGKTALQGNLDPAALLSTPENAAAAAEKTLADYGDSPGHIFNLGHGVDKNTPPENVAAVVEAVRARGIPPPADS